MKVWLVTFVVLLALVEFYQWFHSLQVPLPLMLLAGVVLAIASNLIGSRSSPAPSLEEPPTPDQNSSESEPLP